MAESTGDNDPYTNVGEKYGRLQLPTLDFNAFGTGSSAPAYEPDYLDFNIKGRSVLEKATFNSGMSYLTGITAGGMYGAMEGFRSAPSNRTLIRANSVMNAAGKRGSKLGNAMAVLAFFYTGAECLLDSADLERKLGGADWVPPIAAMGMAGMLYKSTAPLKTMGLAGVVGCSGMGIFYLGSSALSRFSHR